MLSYHKCEQLDHPPWPGWNNCDYSEFSSKWVIRIFITRETKNPFDLTSSYSRITHSASLKENVFLKHPIFQRIFPLHRLWFHNLTDSSTRPEIHLRHWDITPELGCTLFRRIVFLRDGDSQENEYSLPQPDTCVHQRAGSLWPSSPRSTLLSHWPCRSEYHSHPGASHHAGKKEEEWVKSEIVFGSQSHFKPWAWLHGGDETIWRTMKQEQDNV